MKSILFFFLFLTIVSCSRTDLAFHYADTFLAYEIKDQFDFSGTVVDGISTQFVSDVRKEFLPQLISEMQKVQLEFEQMQTDQSTQKSWADWILKKTYDFRNLGYQSVLLLDRQSPAFSKLMKSNNWEEFKKNFEKKNKKLEKEKPESRLKKTLDDFLGSLTKEQEKQIKEFLKNHPTDPVDRAINRRTTLNQFEAKMTQFSSENFKKAASDFLQNPQNYGDPVIQEKIKVRTAALSETLGFVLQSLTPEQTKKLKKTWNKYLTDFSEIHQKAVKP